MVIWKYPLEGAVNRIEMPKGARVIHVDIKRDSICLWAEVEPSLPKEEREFRVIYTGRPFNPYGLNYIASVMDPDRVNIYHVYEDIYGVKRDRRSGEICKDDHCEVLVESQIALQENV
jgi:hypothetical protein